MKTAVFKDWCKSGYPVMQLCSEAGEIAGLVAKVQRKSQDSQEAEETYQDPEFKTKLKKELGDVLWYVAAIGHVYGIDLEDVGITNINKLADRMNRGVIHGNGDER